MNFLKALNGLRGGTIIPEDLRKAVTDGGVSGFTDELRQTLVRDGAAFLGHVEKCGVKVEHLPLRGPHHKQLPEQFKEDGVTEKLTVTCAQVGATVEFINFRPVFETKSIGVIVNWSSVLLWIISHYKWADMKIMTEQMGFLQERGIGIQAARRYVNNAAYVAYFKETGLDLWTDREPNNADREWALGQINKQNLGRQTL